MKKQMSLTAKGSTISMMKVDGEDYISKLVEFDQFKNEAGTNAFVLPPVE